MHHHLTPLLTASIAGAYIGGITFVVVGAYLTIRQRRLHPLLLICIAAISISWIEAPYDWAVYAQFAPAIPRMPSWWPLNMTWGGLPASVPIGYVSYFVLPAFIGVVLARRLSARYQWRRPITLLTTGLVVGFVWAFLFNGILGARMGVFYYGRVIPGLAVWQGTTHQYPLYDALAMSVQMMVFTYLLGRTDAEGGTIVDGWAARRSLTRVQCSALAITGVIVIANLLYGAVFLPHLIAKLQGWDTAGPTTALFRGVPNQPVNGTERGPRLGSAGGDAILLVAAKASRATPDSEAATNETGRPVPRRHRGR
jgi:hypothetical protein